MCQACHFYENWVGSFCHFIGMLHVATKNALTWFKYQNLDW